MTNCFCVPHKEYEDQVDAELNYAMDLYELNRRVNPQENIVGWWATGNEVDETDFFHFTFDHRSKIIHVLYVMTTGYESFLCDSRVLCS